MTKPIHGVLLEQIVNAAKKAGIDQASLAGKAKLAPETLSRSKKRSSMQVQTLAALAKAAGLELTLTQAQPKNVPVFPAPDARHRRSLPLPPLSSPGWGLSWSSRSPTPEALVRNALKKGNYAPILQAVLEYGAPFVQTQLEAARKTRELPEPGASGNELDKMLSNIRRGISLAQA
jgi:transcriptional regulator with XRE-family HTH domain